MIKRQAILDLQPGQQISDGTMSVKRGAGGTDHPDGEILFLFRVEYQEGPLDHICDIYAIQDMAPEPWDLIFDEIQRRARKGQLHDKTGKRI